MINAVSFQGAQPVPEKKEKKSYAATGVVLGAAAGAGTSYFTNLGKVAKYENYDSFEKATADEQTDALKEVPTDKKADVDKVKAGKTASEEATKAADAKVKKLFPDEKTTEVKISDVLAEVEDKPSLDDLKAVQVDGAEKPITEAEAELKAITEKASSLANEKDETIKLKTKDPADAAKEIEIDCKIAKDKDGKVTFVKGSEASKELEAHKKDVEAQRKTFTTRKQLADKLGITKDTTAETKVAKDKVTEALSGAAKGLKEEAAKAFENIKAHLPKKVSGKMVALYAAGGAAVAGIIGAMVKKND